MAAVVEQDQITFQQTRCVDGRRRGNRIVTAVDDPGCDSMLAKAAEARPEVERAQAFPGGLLDSADDAERGEVVRVGRVGEITGDAKLEKALAIGLGVALALAGRGEGFAFGNECWSIATSPEGSVERHAVFARDWGGANEGETSWGWESGAVERHDGVQ